MRGETSVATFPAGGIRRDDGNDVRPHGTAICARLPSRTRTFEPQFSARSDCRLGLGCVQDSRVTRCARFTAYNTSPAPRGTVHFAEATDDGRAALEPDFFCRAFRRLR